MTRIKSYINKMDDALLMMIFTMFFLAIAMLYGVLYDKHIDNQLSSVINNPTFFGEVIEKEEIIHRVGFGTFNQFTTFRLHIIGEYLEDDEVILVDQVFTATSYWFNRFEIGDLIYHP